MELAYRDAVWMDGVRLEAGRPEETLKPPCYCAYTPGESLSGSTDASAAQNESECELLCEHDTAPESDVPPAMLECAGKPDFVPPVSTLASFPSECLPSECLSPETRPSADLAKPEALPAMRDLSRDEINELPMRWYEGEVVLVRTERQLEVALNDLWDEKVLGFDTETRPTFTRGACANPALVQLAAEHKVYLVQLTHIPFDEALAALLGARHIIKAGVAIADDIKGLQRVYDFQPGGVLDLAALARARNIKAQGLRTLSAQLLGFRISKSAQCSNWENRELTQQQIRYAATDAWLGRELYNALISLHWHDAPQ